jgi:hypothetical protein
MPSPFQFNGAPTGYDQIAPGRDLPKATQPGAPGRPAAPPLQQAIMGPSQYQQDPLLAAWRAKQPNVQTGLGTNAQGQVTPPTQPTAPSAPDGLGWIDSALKAADSTDNPSYWHTQIGNDPKVAAGDESAKNYWIDRINRGDGAAAVRSGKVQPYGDQSHGTAHHMMMFHQQQVANPFLQNAILGQQAQPANQPSSLISAIMQSGLPPQY